MLGLIRFLFFVLFIWFLLRSVGRLRKRQLKFPPELKCSGFYLIK